MTSSLENLTGPGKALAKEPPDAKEFAGLKRSGLARLADAQTESLSLEGRFDLAYNAAHALCLAALRWHGYRAQHPTPTRMPLQSKRRPSYAGLTIFIASATSIRLSWVARP